MASRGSRASRPSARRRRAADAAPARGRLARLADRLGLAESALHLAIAVAVLAGVALALYHRQLLLGRTFVLRDHLVYTWTERKVLADALRAGRLPEWNDLVGFGTQFAASSANGVTYPPLWIVGILSLPLSMDLAVAAHVLWAGVGTALLSRRLGASALGAAFAGAALMACGYVASVAPNKVFVGTAWLPWVAWASDRVACADADGRAAWRARVRAAGALAAALGIQLLAGDPVSSVTSGLVAAFVVLARAPRRVPALAGLAAACAAAVLLGAASVFPGLALLPHTSRAALSYAEGARWSLHPWRLLELVWPGALGSPIDPRTDLAELLAHSAWGALDPSWSLSQFLGAPVLALAALSAVARDRGARGLWLGAAALVVLALGVYTPVYSAFRAALPAEQIGRYPEKHAAGALVLVCALAGAGVSRLPGRSARAAAWPFIAALAALAVPLSCVALFRARAAESLRGAASVMVPPIDVEAALGMSLRSGAAALAVGLAASALLLASTRPAWARRAAPAAMALLVAHAAAEGWAVTPVASSEQLSRPPVLVRGLLGGSPSAAGPPPRILRSPHHDSEIEPALQAECRHETLLLDGPGRFGFAAVPGFEGWRSREFAQLWGGAQGMPLAAFEGLYAIDLAAVPRELGPALVRADPGAAQPLLAELVLDFAASPRDPGGACGFSLVRSAPARPRAFVAPRWRFAPPSAAVSALVAPGRGSDPALAVLAGTGSDSPAGARDVALLSPCDIVAYRPERVALRCRSPLGGYAVLVEENAPGWTATVDGAAAPISTADVLLRAVPVGAGEHRIEFTYRTPLLRVGIAVSALSWIAWLAVGWWSRRRGESGAAASTSGSA